jgi:hypothetical protein
MNTTTETTTTTTVDFDATWEFLRRGTTRIANLVAGAAADLGRSARSLEDAVNALYSRVDQLREDMTNGYIRTNLGDNAPFFDPTDRANAVAHAASHRNAKYAALVIALETSGVLAGSDACGFADWVVANASEVY